MNARIRIKIARRMYAIDDLISFARREGYDSEIPRLITDLATLGRRWPVAYRWAFLGIDRANELAYHYSGGEL